MLIWAAPAWSAGTARHLPELGDPFAGDHFGSLAGARFSHFLKLLAHRLIEAGAGHLVAKPRMDQEPLGHFRLVRQGVAEVCFEWPSFRHLPFLLLPRAFALTNINKSKMLNQPQSPGSLG